MATREQRIAKMVGGGFGKTNGQPNYDTFPGTELKRIISQRYKISPCQSCHATANRMDRRGVDWCRAHIGQLAEELHQNAQQRAWTAILDKMAWGMFGDKHYRSLILEAIDAADPRPQGPARDLCFLWTYIDEERQGDELRWSLRSVSQNYKGAAELILVGDKPHWYCGKHLPMERVGECYRRRYRDVLNKLIAACKSDLVADTFCWQMDDVYFIKPGVTYDWLAKNQHQGTNPPNKPTLWGNKELQDMHAETYEVLREELPQMANRIADFATHKPMLFHKEQFLNMVEMFGLEERTLKWESIYNVAFHEFSTPIDYTFQLLCSSDQTSMDDAFCISNGAAGWTPQFRRRLAELLPDRCEAESADPDFKCPRCGK
jgi:hypothetical protein